MKLYLCSVRLNDSANHIVPNKQVTIPEIAVLQRIHGAPAVTNLRPFVQDGAPAVKMRDNRPITDAEERERLTLKYQRSGDEGGVNIEKVFGAMGALPKTLREIGIDPQAAAADLRRQAEEMAASAAQLDTDDPPASDEDAFFDEPETAAAPAKKVA